MNQPQIILFKLATRSRREKFFASLDNILANIEDKRNFRILISADYNDDAMDWPYISERFMINYKEYTGKISLIYGTSKSKIDAVNRDVNNYKENWDILINTSDDMVFQVPGFDNIIRKHFAESFPDTDGFLHLNDGNQKENVCTLSVMGKRYYDRFKYIYHPDYTSLWSDCEETEKAVMLGKYKYVPDQLFSHAHPAWGLAEYDEQYRKTEGQDMWSKDYQVILQRRARKYDLKESEIVNGFKYKNI